MDSARLKRILGKMIHIQRFIERLQGFEARGARDFTMPIKDAKDLHADLTRLLIALQAARESAVNAAQESEITVEMKGGSF
jgi:hypothetical protein